MAGFDGVARIYHALEVAAFGGALQRARTTFLDCLTACRDVLVLGDGDGRFLRALLDAAPNVHVHSVDASTSMLSLAERRVRPADRVRVTFEHMDARRFDPGARNYDAVVTLFFLDCFVDTDVAAIVARVRPHLRPGGLWIFSDFAIPPRGLARRHAQVMVGALYRFFRWRTGIEARALPASESILERAGLVPVSHRDFRAGLIRSVVYLAESR
jgi:SAM-dependent methyltransferase